MKKKVRRPLPPIVRPVDINKQVRLLVKFLVRIKKLQHKKILMLSSDNKEKKLTGWFLSRSQLKSPLSRKRIARLIWVRSIISELDFGKVRGPLFVKKISQVLASNMYADQKVFEREITSFIRTYPTRQRLKYSIQ